MKEVKNMFREIGEGLEFRKDLDLWAENSAWVLNGVALPRSGFVVAGQELGTRETVELGDQLIRIRDSILKEDPDVSRWNAFFEARRIVLDNVEKAVFLRREQDVSDICD